MALLGANRQRLRALLRHPRAGEREGDGGGFVWVQPAQARATIDPVVPRTLHELPQHPRQRLNSVPRLHARPLVVCDRRVVTHSVLRATAARTRSRTMTCSPPTGHARPAVPWG